MVTLCVKQTEKLNQMVYRRARSELLRFQIMIFESEPAT